MTAYNTSLYNPTTGIRTRQAEAIRQANPCDAHARTRRAADAIHRYGGTATHRVTGSQTLVEFTFADGSNLTGIAN